MSYVNPIFFEDASPAARHAASLELEARGSLTNTQRTLLHSAPAFSAYAQWYPLWDEVVAVLGQRGAVIYAHEISRASNCQLCTASFRRALAGLGLDPDEFRTTPEEEPIIALGQAAGRPADPIHPETWARLKEHFTEKDLVNLVAFAGLMVATNLFNNLVQVRLDEALVPFEPAGNLIQPDFAWDTL